MKRTLSFVFLSVFCLAGMMLAMAFSEKGEPMAQQAVEKADYTITLSPGTKVKQGTPLIVKLDAPQDLPENAHAVINGSKGKFFKQDNGLYEALLGVSVDAQPGVQKLEVKTADGKVLATEYFQVLDAQFKRQNITVSKGTKGLQPLPGEMEAIQALKVNVTPVRHWDMPMVSPTIDCQNSPFGVKRYHNGVYTKDYHKGVDLRSPQGRPIRAIADGVVKIAAPQFRLHGGTVGLDHGQGLNSIYIHMSKLAVKQGQKVQKGETIGYVGSTGFATGPHLHWGLYAGGIPVNPDEWIKVQRCS